MSLFALYTPLNSPPAPPIPESATLFLGSPFNANRYSLAVSAVLTVVSLLLLGLHFY